MMTCHGGERHNKKTTINKQQARETPDSPNILLIPFHLSWPYVPHLSWPYVPWQLFCHYHTTKIQSTITEDNLICEADFCLHS